VLVGAYRLGAGRFVLNILRVLENLDRHPAADRLLLNVIDFASQPFQQSPVSENLDQVLARIGY
jgi:hypothetical protein